MIGDVDAEVLLSLLARLRFRKVSEETVRVECLEVEELKLFPKRTDAPRKFPCLFFVARLVEVPATTVVCERRFIRYATNQVAHRVEEQTIVERNRRGRCHWQSPLLCRRYGTSLIYVCQYTQILAKHS